MYHPPFVKASDGNLDIVDCETKDHKDLKLKYADHVAAIDDYFKNRQGMIDSYANGYVLHRKIAEHA